MNLAILSLNAWTGYDPHGRLVLHRYESQELASERHQALCRFILDLNPHLVALQEVCPLPVAARLLGTKTNSRAVCQIANAGVKCCGFGLPRGFSEGLVILVRRGGRVNRVVRQQLSGPRCTLLWQHLCIQFAESRWLLGVQVAGLTDHPIWVFTLQTHFSPPAPHQWPHDHVSPRAFKDDSRRGGDETADVFATTCSTHVLDRARRRENELRRAFEFITRVVGTQHPCIIAGDLNSDLSDPSLESHLRSYRFDNAAADCPAPSWNPECNPLAALSTLPTHASDAPKQGLDLLAARWDGISRRIDHVLFRSASCTWDTRGQVIPAQDSTGKWFSDHHALLVDGEFLFS